VPTRRGVEGTKKPAALTPEGLADSEELLREQDRPYAAKKSRSVEVLRRPYRKPTQVGRGKSPKVNERTIVKELGKLAP
jgi:hypothetical protein